MKKFVFVILISVASVIGISAILFAYSYTQIYVGLSDVKFDSIVWEPISLSSLLNLGLEVLTGNWFESVFDLIIGINLNLIFSLRNNGIFPVYIPDLSYDLIINDISIGKGTGVVDLVIYPGETKEISILQNFQKDRFVPALQSIIDSGGIVEINVQGMAYFKLLGLDVPIPFEASKQISLIDEINDRLKDEFPIELK